MAVAFWVISSSMAFCPLQTISHGSRRGSVAMAGSSLVSTLDSALSSVFWSAFASALASALASAFASVLTAGLSALSDLSAFSPLGASCLAASGLAVSGLAASALGVSCLAAGVGSAANTAGEARAQHRVNKRAVISNLGACMESSDYSRLSLKVDALPYVKKGRLKRPWSLQGAGRAA